MGFIKNEFYSKCFEIGAEISAFTKKGEQIPDLLLTSLLVNYVKSKQFLASEKDFLEFLKVKKSQFITMTAKKSMTLKDQIDDSYIQIQQNFPFISGWVVLGYPKSCQQMLYLQEQLSSYFPSESKELGTISPILQTSQYQVIPRKVC